MDLSITSSFFPEDVPKPHYHFLIIEDNTDDTFFLVRYLKKHGFDFSWTQVDSHTTLLQALEQREWDLVLCDYHLPGFSGMDALAILKNQGSLAPFIIISGQIGEDAAVSAMRAGASDYVLKEHLNRLAPAIERELAESAKRKQLLTTRTLNKELAEELIAARDRALKSSKHKSDVLAFVAHEVKNPLKAIELFTDQLIVDSARLPDPTVVSQYHEKLSYIQEAVNDARAILEDIADIAKIESNTVELNWEGVPLQHLFDQVERTCQSSAMRKAITLHFEIQTSVNLLKADPLRLKQILVNLVTNAIKYSPENTCVHVTCTTATTPELGVDDMVFTVKDEGYGISEEEQAYLFEEFYRVNSIHRKQTEGLGLGLALVKRLVELHKGSIHVESAVGNGSVFTIRLPREAVPSYLQSTTSV